MADNTPPFLPNAPTKNIVPDLSAYLLTIPEINYYFNATANYYRRQDYSDRQLPALNLYESSQTLDGGIWWLNGEIKLEGVLPPQFKRTFVVDNVKYATDLLFLYLNAADTILALVDNNPGLTDLGSSILRWDYAKSIGVDEKANIDAYIITGTINYRINLLEYYEAIQTGDEYQTASINIIPISIC